MDFIIFHNSTVTTVTGGQKNTIRKNIKSSSFEKVSCAESHLSQLTKSLPNPVTSVTVVFLIENSPFISCIYSKILYTHQWGTMC